MFTLAFFLHFELALILSGIGVIPYIIAEKEEIKKKNKKSIDKQ